MARGVFLPRIFLIAFCLWITFPVLAQQQQILGSIIGHVRAAAGDVPLQGVLVTLELRGAPTDSVYTDSQGTFGFHNLGPNPYTVVVNDDHYQPTQMTAVIESEPATPMIFLEVRLVPKISSNGASDSGNKLPASNRNMTDVRDYSSRFPKNALKEFEKGRDADANGNRDEAILHYQKALSIAPEFYLAHNNLGSDYLSKSDFAGARKEFESVLQLNQSDAAAYFNLSNACMLMGELQKAQHYLDEGLRREPNSALGHFLMGSLNIRLGKAISAEVELRRTIQLNPAMAQARLQLINLLLQQGRRTDAVSQLREFLTSCPDSPYRVKAEQVLRRLESSKAASN